MRALTSVLILLAVMAIGTSGDKIIRRGNSRQRGGRARTSFRQSPRSGRQGLTQTGGIDFSGCITDPDTGFCCVEVEESVTTLKRDPILECTHKQVEKCHYTYVTQFEPTAEEICKENFEKICQITFKQEATEEEVEKCYKPLIKSCDGQGEEICQTIFESSCTTRYIEKQPGKFVGDTKCEKQPVDICGAGCTVTEGPEECHDKTVISLIDIPEEVCDLNPQKTCQFQTKLVPKLKPEHECTIIPQEVCNLKFSNPEQIDAPLKTKWCQDPAPPTPGETYSEAAAEAPILPGYSQAPVNEPPPASPQANIQPFSGRQESNGFSFPQNGVSQQQFTNNINDNGFSSNNQTPVFTQQVSNQFDTVRPRQGRRRGQGRQRQRQQNNQFTEGQNRQTRMVSKSEAEEEKAMIPKFKVEEKKTAVAKAVSEKSMASILGSLPETDHSALFL